MQAHSCTCVRMHEHVCTCMHMHEHACICVHMHVHMCMGVCMFSCVHTRVCLCMYLIGELQLELRWLIMYYYKLVLLLHTSKDYRFIMVVVASDLGI